MPFESVLFLGIVIGSLIVFTVTLSYGQWITRNVNEAGASPAVKSSAGKPVKPSRHSADAHPQGAAHV